MRGSNASTRWERTCPRASSCGLHGTRSQELADKSAPTAKAQSAGLRHIHQHHLGIVIQRLDANQRLVLDGHAIAAGRLDALDPDPPLGCDQTAPTASDQRVVTALACAQYRDSPAA